MNLKQKKILAIFIGGILFGFGLAFSSMTKPEIILNFLELNDLGLLVVMFTAILVFSPTYFIFKKIKKQTIFQEDFNDKKMIFNKKIFIGAIIFGTGWGISGLCPGSAIASIGTGNYPVLLGIIGMFIGAYIPSLFKK